MSVAGQEQGFPCPASQTLLTGIKLGLRHRLLQSLFTRTLARGILRAREVLRDKVSTAKTMIHCVKQQYWNKQKISSPNFKRQLTVVPGSRRTVVSLHQLSIKNPRNHKDAPVTIFSTLKQAHQK